MPPNSNERLSPDQVRSRVFQILHSHSDARMGLAAVTDQTPLIEEGLCLDSLDLLDSIIEIENEWNLRLREEELTDEVFATAGGFADHVCDKVAMTGE